MTATPRTEAGGRLLNVMLPRYDLRSHGIGKWTRAELTDAILAIEAEAAAEPLRLLTALVETDEKYHATRTDVHDDGPFLAARVYLDKRAGG
jgi:hypothetical protein